MSEVRPNFAKDHPPQSWTKTNLGMVVWSASTKADPAENRNARYVGLEHIIPGESQFRSVGKASDVRSTKNRFLSGDILYGKLRPYLNKVAIPNFPGICSTDILVLRPEDGIENVFVEAVLRTYRFIDFATKSSSGINLPRTSFEKIAPFEFWLAPTEEQKRIAAKLRRLLARERRLRQQLDELPALIQQYRGAVLEAACTGHLVPTEAELARKRCRDFEPASVLLERILAERRAEWERQELARMKVSKRKPKNAHWKELYREPKPLAFTPEKSLPNGWQWARVDQCGIVQLGRQRSPKYHTGRNLRPYLRVANVFEDRIDVSDVKRMNFTPEEFEVFRLEPNDILLNEGQSLDLIGRPAMYRGEIKGACFQNTLVRFRPMRSIVPEYALAVFRYYLRSRRFRQIGKIVTNLAHLGAGRFADLEFPLPPLAEQKRIVRELGRRLAAIDRTEDRITECATHLSDLRNSLFSRALSGRLTDQRKSDEPALELLARIRGERENRLRTPKRAKIQRKAKMKKLSHEIVKEAISTLPNKRFSFNELSVALQADYDLLKDIVFELLSEPKPTLRQVFDSKAKTMQLERIDQ